MLFKASDYICAAYFQNKDDSKEEAKLIYIDKLAALFSPKSLLYIILYFISILTTLLPIIIKIIKKDLLFSVYDCFPQTPSPFVPTLLQCPTKLPAFPPKQHLLLCKGISFSSICCHNAGNSKSFSSPNTCYLVSLL